VLSGRTRWCKRSFGEIVVIGNLVAVLETNLTLGLGARSAPVSSQEIEMKPFA